MSGAGAAFSCVSIPALTQAGARIAGEAVAAEAGRRGVFPVTAVVDVGGELLYLWRPDGAQVASIGVATDKARTAAIYRRPSKEFEEQASHGRPSALHLARAVPLQGGMPVIFDGQVVGALGVSGASSADEDHALAEIGAQALNETAKRLANREVGRTVLIARKTLEEKFRAGGLLLNERRFKLDAGRRISAGEVEYHEHVIDVMHVVQGSATLVSGGEMLASRMVGDGELRARAIRNGKRQKVGAGNVVSIPNAVPHQFVDVSDPFLYLVVKIEAQ